MKYLLIAIICTLVLSSCGFYTDSYPYSQSFIVDIPYEDSEAIMAKLKETYPEYQDYIYPTYSNDSTLVQRISIVTHTKNDTIVENKDIYASPKNYFVNSKNDTIRYQAGDSIPELDQDGLFQFYLQDIGYSLSCIVLPSNNPKQTHVMLVYAYDKKSKTRKTINTFELTREENKMIKKEFEKQILPKLGKWEYYTPSWLRLLGVN